MKWLTILLVLIVAVTSSCKKLDIAKGTPKCVEKRIKDLDKYSSCSDANVKEYLFQEKTVFVFDPGTCGDDMAADVINEDCISLGKLGGITGNTKINGEEFSSAIFVKTTWEK